MKPSAKKQKAPANDARSPPAPARSVDATRTRILNVAMREFAKNGLSGSRIDEIAAETGSNKRMIYYYFGSKEALFVAALEESYRRMRAIETGFHREDLPALDALRELIGLSFDYHARHPEFVRLVMTENIHNGTHVRQLPTVRAINRPAVTLLEQLCARGVSEGVFRRGIDAVDLHMSISALCFYNVSNQHTFSHIFERELATASVRKARRPIVIEMIVRYVRAP